MKLAAELGAWIDICPDPATVGQCSMFDFFVILQRSLELVCYNMRDVVRSASRSKISFT